MHQPTPQWTRHKQGLFWAAIIFMALSAHAALATPSAPHTHLLARQLATHQGKPGALQPYRLFLPQTSHTVSQGHALTLDQASLARLQTQAPPSIRLSIPGPGPGKVELDLFRQDIFAPGYQVQTSGGEDTRRIKPGLHYRGIIRNDTGSFAAISLFDRQVMGSFSSQSGGSWTLGRLHKSQQHVLTRNSPLSDKRLAPRCMTPPPSSGAEPRAALTRVNPAPPCVTEWLEAEYDIFQSKGSIQAVSNFLTGVFNNSATLYANDGIQLQLSQLYIWTSEDPYNGNDTSSNLASFQQYRANSFNGTIAQLLTFRPLGGGVAAGFSGVCNPDRRASMSTSSIYDTSSEVPVFSWTVDVISHEAGHLLGSRHTHACVWNGNNSAIDGCAGYVEGSCSLPGQPAGGGTVMSYCHLTQTGVNFNLGFGAQPARAIRDQISAGSCANGCSTAVPLTPLQNHTPISNLTAAANADSGYTIQVPAGTQVLEFNTWGGSGDADIYVKQGSMPTLASASCQSTAPGTRETCRIEKPAAGTWYLLLHPYSAINQVKLNASLASGCNGELTLGLLQSQGEIATLPVSGAYLTHAAGIQHGASSGPANAVFNLELNQWNGSIWSKVASSNTLQPVDFNGPAAWYRWQLRALQGSGGYSLCQSHPD